MKELRKTQIKEGMYTYEPVKKLPTCIRLTENGKIKLHQLCKHFGFNQSTMIELIITLYHEKITKEEKT